MDFKGFFKKEHVIGLDIGSSSVKMAYFMDAPAGGSLRLVQTEMKEFKHSEDSALNDQEIISALKSSLKNVDLHRSRVIVNINCPHTAIKKVVAPYMPKAELRAGILLEAKNYFPFPVDGSVLDFEILGDIVDKGARKYEVIVAVSPKNTVDRYLSLLERAGVKPDSFVCTSYALKRIAAHLYASGDETKCFIDIGEFFTELIIVKGRDLVFSRKLPVCAGDFTRAMTGMLVSDRGKTQLSFDEAQKIKASIGIPSGSGAAIIDGKISAAQVLSMLQMPMEQLAGEIGRSFDYFREESSPGKIDSVVMFGGGSALRGLVKYLSETLGIEVRVGDPLQGLDLAPGAVRDAEKISYRLELAVASALSGGKGINLLPVEIKEKTKIVMKRGVVETIATVVVLSLILINVGMRIQLANFQKRGSVARLELASLRDELKKIEEQDLANKVLINEPQWEDFFKELSNIIPETVHISNLRLDNNIIVIKGTVSSTDGDQILANFILTLERGIFDNVKLVESKRVTDPPGVEFEIKCWVDYEDR